MADEMEIDNDLTRLDPREAFTEAEENAYFAEMEARAEADETLEDLAFEMLAHGDVDNAMVAFEMATAAPVVEPIDESKLPF